MNASGIRPFAAEPIGERQAMVLETPAFQLMRREVAQLLPLPEEYLNTGRSLDDARSLLHRLQSCPESQWGDFALDLTQQERYVIPLCYCLCNDKNSLQRLDQLLLNEPSWSLYEACWLIFCFHYPNTKLQRVLNMLYHQLKQLGLRRPEHLEQLPQDLLRFTDLDQQFVERLCQVLFWAQEKDEAQLSASQEKNLDPYAHERLPGVRPPRQVPGFYQAQSEGSSHTPPQHSPSASPEVQVNRGKEKAHPSSDSALEHTPEAIKRMLARCHLPLNSQLAAAVFGQYLKEVPFEAYLRLLPLTLEFIPYLDDGVLAQYSRRCLDEKGLDTRLRRRLMDPVLALMDQPERAQGIFAALGLREAHALRRWRILSLLQEHCLGDPNKQAFYLDYLQSIQDLTRLSSHSLALRFDHFTLVDDLLDPEHCFYYPDRQLATLLRHGVRLADLGQPKFPYRRLSDPERLLQSRGTVELPLCGPGRKLSREFLDRLLAMTPRSNSSSLGRWLRPVFGDL